MARLSAGTVPFTTSSIETRSRREAMDWSLVLASQSIECLIEHRPDEDLWLLTVPEPDMERATVAIRTYEQENASVWRHEVKWTGLLFDGRAIFWWLFVCAVSFIAWEVRPNLHTAGVMSTKAFFAGQWWRAFTAVLLHADAPHLALNVATGCLLLGLAMGFYRPGTALLAAFIAGAGANVAAAYIRATAYHGLGASGMVMGTLGLLGAQSLFERHHSAREWIARGLIASSLLLVLIGLDTRSDVLAHVLGFVNGVVFGIPLCLLHTQLSRRRWLDGLAGLFCAALIVLTWFLALSSARSE